MLLSNDVDDEIQQQQQQQQQYDFCLEQQEMEAEALTAIFDTCMEIRKDTQPFEWVIALWPEQEQLVGEEQELDYVNNHVGIQVVATIPLDYPETSLPQFQIHILKGLTNEHGEELVEIANEEAMKNQGMPVLYAVCERLKEWLVENNEQGLDDPSMYAQMIKREKQKEKDAHKAQLHYESQKQKEELTEAEMEELVVRKRRAEGTPCTDQTFSIWKDQFEAEQRAKTELVELDAVNGSSGNTNDGKKKSSNNKSTASDKKVNKVDKSSRLTGFQLFSGKTGTLDWEAMEAATENAQRDEDEVEDEEYSKDDDDGEILDDVDEGLFDVDDDDLDELEFDDDEEDEDDNEDEPDI